MAVTSAISESLSCSLSEAAIPVPSCLDVLLHVNRLSPFVGIWNVERKTVVSYGNFQQLNYLATWQNYLRHPKIHPLLQKMGLELCNQDLVPLPSAPGLLWSRQNNKFFVLSIEDIQFFLLRENNRYLPTLPDYSFTQIQSAYHEMLEWLDSI